MSIVLATVCLAGNMFSCQPMQVKVIDGDTFQINSERVRVVGIDAPEMKGACAAEIRKARMAKDRAAELISTSKVTIERKGRDKYRRTLARISVNGRDLGDILMKEGLARKWEQKWRPGLDEVWCSGRPGAF